MAAGPVESWYHEKESAWLYGAVAAAEPDPAKRHSSAGGKLRAAVFGASDGLVSNASLVTGVAVAGSVAVAGITLSLFTRHGASLLG